MNHRLSQLVWPALGEKSREFRRLSIRFSQVVKERVGHEAAPCVLYIQLRTAPRLSQVYCGTAGNSWVDESAEMGRVFATTGHVTLSRRWLDVCAGGHGAGVIKDLTRLL